MPLFFAGVGRGGGWHFYNFFLKTRGERDQRCWLLRWCSQKEMMDCDGTEREDDVAQPRASKQRSANLKRAMVTTTIATHQKVHRSM
jgi:hypothetical protein